MDWSFSPTSSVLGLYSEFSWVFKFMKYCFHNCIAEIHSRRFACCILFAHLTSHSHPYILMRESQMNDESGVRFAFCVSQLLHGNHALENSLTFFIINLLIYELNLFSDFTGLSLINLYLIRSWFYLPICL